jgi:hypothetical protein
MDAFAQQPSWRNHLDHRSADCGSSEECHELYRLAKMSVDPIDQWKRPLPNLGACAVQ